MTLPIATQIRNRRRYRAWTKTNIFPAQPFLFASHWERVREAVKAAQLSREARKRVEWIIWYETVGRRNGRLTCRHFGISPKVFYFWRKRFSVSALSRMEERSHRPRRTRASMLNSLQIERVVELRREFMLYSKMKLAIIYRERHGEPISTWQIQKIIQRFELYPNKKRASTIAAKRKRAWKKKRITDLVAKPETGYLFCLDTIVRHIEGHKRYILTAIDRQSRFAFARMYSSHSSLTAADFLRRLHMVMNGQMAHIQTDNGSEFHKHFMNAAKELQLQHWWSRTKSPKDNAVCERFNRTLQDEFIGQGNATQNIAVFNQKLTHWLIEYDFHRPHAALGYKRPIEVAGGVSNVLPINSSHTNS